MFSSSAFRLSKNCIMDSATTDHKSRKAWKSTRHRRKLLQQLGDVPLEFLSPKDNGFHQLWSTQYAKLVIQEADRTPVELHQAVQKAFLTLLHHGCLSQDLVQLKGKDLLTAVSRILIGEPGCTYKYLNTRLFAVPWSEDAINIGYSTEDVSNACKAFYTLNQFLHLQTTRELSKLVRSKPLTDHPGDLQEQMSSHGDFGQEEARCFNVTLINYMNPQTMTYLREEPYFGMGKMAVSWHHDENLVEGSTVAVYNYSYKDDAMETFEEEAVDASKWRVGLKIAWDIETPGLALPLNPGDSYFMLDDLNTTHQHCVLAGPQPRFSSTHRVAECSSGTFSYIQTRCEKALENLCVLPDSGKAKLQSLEVEVLQQAEEIHNEVEFDWLRQYWFQGARYSRCSDYWLLAMAKLEEQWRQMETMTSLLLEELEKDYWSWEDKYKILHRILPLLVERQDLRLGWRKRCSLAKSLPMDQRPRCHPYWEEDDFSMPLPFDLSQILTKLENFMEKD
ncbi:alpha-ketoglutarate-dependent dioxygenase FTO isoform X2 [Bufo bufo]|uniref:alpha-ketoglutarate-dependent dioxygenase FTO isoform X2 n=1 Tax=Bufo bufo TaxID=8384 RepID=UPI001ABEC8EA|nr:alpha-ketoglutarate-dependent dioxygenase FTO isoform X2 [Bufo bufo]